MITYSKPCPICRAIETYTFDATLEQLEAWNNGELIQNAMPQLQPDEREVFITGMCYSCQSQVFQ